MINKPPDRTVRKFAALANLGIGVAFKEMTNQRNSLLRMHLVLSILVPMCLGSVAACGGDEEGEESFDNLPDCVEDHASLGEAEAIAHCLVDFPDLHGGLADQQACVDFVTANGGYPDSRDAACTDYFEETGA